MTSKLKILVGASALTCSIIGGTNVVHAAGTTQGTDILNTVTVDFQVGGVDQTQQSASDTFEVDRVVRFIVAEATATGTTSVSPGEQNAVTTFTLTNTSNDVLDFSLAASQIATAGATPTGADAFDVNNLEFFVDNGDGVFNAADDTVTSIDNLAEDASVTVFIIGDVGLAEANGSIAGVTLTGTALNSDGSAIAASDDSDVNTAGVETIFGDTGRDGIESANDDYTVAAAVLTATKVSRVVSDPFSSANPKAVPGAVIEYCIAVSNAAGAATATGITLSDNLSTITGVTFDTSFTPAINGAVFDAVTSTCTAGPDAGTFTAGTNTVSGILDDVAANETRTLVFRVIIE